MHIVKLEDFREERVEEAWYAYVRAKERADETLDIRDGIAAGKAWRTMLLQFERMDDHSDKIAKQARAS